MDYSLFHTHPPRSSPTEGRVSALLLGRQELLIIAKFFFLGLIFLLWSRKSFLMTCTARHFVRFEMFVWMVLKVGSMLVAHNECT